MKLYFAGEPKDVPTKAVISKKLLRSIESPVATLRALGQNAAFMEALRKSPNAAKIVTISGGANTQYTAQIHAAIKAEIPNITDDDARAMVSQRVQADLLESFPEIWDALNNPITDFPLNNDEAVDACIEVLKQILDQSQLTEQEKALLSVDGFWDDQDLTEVTNAVRSFREITKL